LKKGAAAIETPSVITAMISSIIFWEGSGGGIGAKVDSKVAIELSITVAAAATNASRFREYI
jgi:hypothetical protein